MELLNLQLAGILAKHAHAGGRGFSDLPQIFSVPSPFILRFGLIVNSSKFLQLRIVAYDLPIFMATGADKRTIYCKVSCFSDNRNIGLFAYFHH